VAIVQISRITQRKGRRDDLPQPLAAAELGWAADTRQLFIGNGTLEDGAPIIGNTEVLTEFSDILSFATQYIYQGDAAGYTVQTGSTPGDPVAQSLQRRLDSYAIITDFGPTGDGVTDVTADINRALNQIFCQSINPAARRSLYFPAGTYIITDTLRIPPNCQLYGDGPDSTIISFNVQIHSSAVPYAAGVLVKSGSSYYRSNFPVPVGINIGDSGPSGPYWTEESLPEYIVRTADSGQQIGTNSGAAGRLLPSNIEIYSMKFVTNQIQNGVLLEKATRCVFDSVTVQGPLGIQDLDTDADDIVAVQWSSAVNIVTRNISWTNSEFSGFTYATNTQQQIQGATFDRCNFDTLYQGVVLGGASPVAGGPTGVRLVHCIFDQIYGEGVVIDGVSHNATAYNSFYNVANGFSNNYDNAISSIIQIDAENNVSIGDMFVRNTDQSLTYPRINLGTSSSIALGMTTSGITYYQDNVQNDTIANQLSLGRYQRTAGIQDNLFDDSTVTRLVKINVDELEIPTFKMDYSIVRNGFYRTGTITVVAPVAPGTTGFSYCDDYVDNGSTGVTLEAVPDAGTATVTIQYTASGAGDGTIQYSIAHIN
jgi:hypothetical protein